MSIRIFNLAKQLSVESKEIIDACQKLGLKKKSAFNTVNEEEIALIGEYLKRQNAAKSSETTQSYFAVDRSITGRQPAHSNSNLTGKVRRLIMPARGRISNIDPTVRDVPVKPAEPTESPVENANLTPSPASAQQPEQHEALQKPETQRPEAVQPVVAEPAAPEISKAQTSDDVAETKPTETTPVASAPVESTPVETAPVETKPTEPEVAEPRVSEEQVPEKETPKVAAAEAESSVDSGKTTESEPEKKVDSDRPAEAAVSATQDETKTAPTPDSQPVAASDSKPAETKPAEISTTAQSSQDKREETKTIESPAADASKDAVKASETPEPAQSVATAAPAKSELGQDRTGSARRPAAPLRQAMERRGAHGGRDSGRDSSGRDAQSRGKNGRDRRQNQPAAPTRPAPVTSSFISQLEMNAQKMQEMKRPPIITTGGNDRVRVLGQPLKSKKDENEGASAKSTSPRVGAGLHLAPIPVQAQKPQKPVAKEPAAQKPEKKLPVEVLRAAASGGSGPLLQRIRTAQSGGQKPAQTGRAFAHSTGKEDSQRNAGFSSKRNERAESNFSDSKPSNKKNRGGRDRDENGREDRRGTTTNRREGNARLQYRNGADDDYDYRPISRSGQRKRDKSSSVSVTAPRKNDVVIETPCTLKYFAEATGLSVAAVIKKLIELGYMKTMNQLLEREEVEMLILEFELKATVKEQETLEEQYVDSMYDMEDDPDSLLPRAPVVTFLGHVDHGKTSLLDKILNLHVVDGESGGITQHIRAYRVKTAKGYVTFVDTPGHEAFTEMRARGANCTDIAVLVVAADDGVMPQTEEAISHARAAGVPIVVALNKMDLPGVNRDKVVQELANNDLMPAEWGGDVEIVETSALTGMGVDKLLETLVTIAELNDLKANPNRPAMGVVLESSQQSGQGVVCKALVQKGTLRNGDVVLCGSSFGKVRSMTDTLDSRKRIKEAGPSVPITLTGLDTPPEAGSKFVVLEDVSIARQIAEERAQRSREIELAGSRGHITLESLFGRLKEARSQQVLNVIIRADVRGSIEAIRKELGKLDHPEVKIKILQASVGGVTEADVQLADASDAIIVGFNVVPDERARALSETKQVQIRRYDVIYKLTEDIRAALEGMLKPIEQVKELGRALVQRTFNNSKVGVIAGCRVLSGVIERNCTIRLIRDSRIIGEYPLETLRREKDDAREVREGYECGMKLKGFNDVKEGDVLEAYKIEEIARKLD